MTCIGMNRLGLKPQDDNITHEMIDICWEIIDILCEMIDMLWEMNDNPREMINI